MLVHALAEIVRGALAVSGVNDAGRIVVDALRQLQGYRRRSGR